MQVSLADTNRPAGSHCSCEIRQTCLLKVIMLIHMHEPTSQAWEMTLTLYPMDLAPNSIQTLYVKFLLYPAHQLHTTKCTLLNHSHHSIHWSLHEICVNAHASSHPSREVLNDLQIVAMSLSQVCILPPKRLPLADLLPHLHSPCLCLYLPHAHMWSERLERHCCLQAPCRLGAAMSCTMEHQQHQMACIKVYV